MTIPTIPLFTGDVPDRNQQSAPVFTVNAIDWLDYQVIQIPATNATVEGINLATIAFDADVLAAAASAAASAASADASASSATISQSNANFKGRWSDATGAATIPATYSNNGKTWQLLQDIADITADEPLPLAANWQVVDDINMSNVNVSELDNPLTHLYKKNKFVETLVGNVSSTRNTIATRVDINGIVRDVAIDDPREEEAGWLFEGESENLILHSDDFTDGVWVKTGIGAGSVPIVTADSGVAPDGTMTADRIQFAIGSNISGDRSLIRQSVVTVAEGTEAIWLKSNTGGNQEIELHTAGNTESLTVVTTEWARVAVGRLIAGAGLWGLELRGGSGTGDLTSDILVWRCEVEELPFASSGIKTLATTESRSADDQSFPSAENFRESEGAIFLKADVIGDLGISQVIVDINDDSLDNRIVIFRSSAGEIFLIISTEGVNEVFSSSLISMLVNTQYEIALNYKDNDVELFVNRVSVIKDIVATMPTGLTAVNIGKGITGGELFGHIQDLRFYPEQLNLDEIKYLGGT